MLWVLVKHDLRTVNSVLQPNQIVKDDVLDLKVGNKQPHELDFRLAISLIDITNK